MRIKHPYGSRLRRRLTPSGPSLNFSSQKIFGTKTVSNWFIQNLWFPSVNWRASPLMAHGLGASSNTIVLTDVCRGWSSYQSKRMVVGQPIMWFTAPATSLGTHGPSRWGIRRGINIHIGYFLVSCVAFLVDKALSFFERNLVAQHVIRSTSELVRHGHARNHNALLR